PAATKYFPFINLFFTKATIDVPRVISSRFESNATPLSGVGSLICLSSKEVCLKRDKAALQLFHIWQIWNS
ncbi:MAG TPA: hypothetical protein VMR70_03115, partial [Flavisolibacter sp.]|nr:hypothetical protein [Flavisolibacter sp.]